MDDFFDKVKETADKAKDGATKITKHIFDKTSNAISQTKLSFAVNETENKIKAVYEDMGKTVYEQYKNGNTVCDCMTERCKQIDDLKEAVCELKEKIAELKDSVKCECGEFNKKTAEFCSKCGKSLKNTAEEFADEVEDVVVDVAEKVVDAADNVVDEAKEKVISIKAKKPHSSESEEK